MSIRLRVLCIFLFPNKHIWLNYLGIVNKAALLNDQFNGSLVTPRDALLIRHLVSSRKMGLPSAQVTGTSQLECVLHFLSSGSCWQKAICYCLAIPHFKGNAQKKSTWINVAIFDFARFPNHPSMSTPRCNSWVRQLCCVMLLLLCRCNLVSHTKG